MQVRSVGAKGEFDAPMSDPLGFVCNQRPNLLRRDRRNIVSDDAFAACEVKKLEEDETP